MTKQELKDALAVIWALVYRATQVPYLSQEQTSKLRDALSIISKGIESDNFFNGRASYLRDSVLTCGILSLPSRQPHDTETIMGDCERLQQYLDRKQ